MNWMDKFQDHILERGYYYTCNVKNVKKIGGNVEAIVEGTNKYHVKINLDDYSMSCTCPYFEKANCKHLAAVLFCFENEKREDFDIDVEISQDIEEIFNMVTTEEKLNFLLKLLKNDKRLSNIFRKEFFKDIDSEYYQTKLSDILIEENFDYELSNFVENDMMELYDLKEYNLVLELLKESSEAVFEKMMFDNYYDANFYTFENIVKKLITSPIRSEVFHLITWQLSYYTNIYGIDSLIKFYSINFNNNEELVEKISAINKILEKSPVYEKEFVLIKIDAMKKLNKSISEINEFRENYSYFEVKQQYIDEAIDNENYDLAIKLIKKELNNNTPYLLIEDYNCQLKELYLKINDMNNYKKQLEKLLFEYEYSNINYYIEYKKLFGNWGDVREYVFKKIHNQSFLNECYNHEKLFDRLVLNLTSEYELNRYKNILKNKYPKELLDGYIIVISKLVSKSGSRKHYKNIAKLLKDMKNIDGGEKIVNDMLEGWKVKYKRRTAMLDELQSLM